MLTVSDSNYLSVVNNDTVVIDFMADWCQPCKGVGEILTGLANKYKGVLFVKVNVDQSPAMANVYNVGSIPTVLVLLNGEPKATFVGSKCTLASIKKVLDTL
jgi:thioredoxin